MEFHHAGIATDDADALADRFGTICGAPVVHEEKLDDLQVTFLDLGNGYFELLEPLAREGDRDGTIATYLERNGPGIHHLALATADVQGAIDAARGAGVTPIDDEPREGAWGHEIAFLHPESTGGVLLEFVGE